MGTKKCAFCGELFLAALRACPHCAQPSLFPNVDLASDADEKAALDKRYQEVVDRAKASGKQDCLSDFQRHVEQSGACKGLPRWELDRLASSDTATAATFFQQVDGRCRIPDDNRWDRLRRLADATFFESFGADIHFAALTTEGRWLSNYGHAAVFFKDTMISHRASLFQENTAVWVDERNGNLEIPEGHRAVWDDRSRLAVAKLGDEACLGVSDSASLLLSCGKSSGDDSFIEVHICGGFTIRSASAIVVRQGQLSDCGRADILVRVAELGLGFTEIP